MAARTIRRRLGLIAVALVLGGCSTTSPTPSIEPSQPGSPGTESATPGTSVTAEPGTTPEPTPAVIPAAYVMATFAVPTGSRPHDVAPALDGGVWYTAQGSGELGWLDPFTGAVREVPLGSGSAPHGVIVGPDGAAWLTDGGLNAIVRVDAVSREVRHFRLSGDPVGLNTAAFDGDGTLWFTGQAGFYGRLDPATGELDVHAAPRGPGPYGIAATPSGDVYFSSLAGSYLGPIDRGTGAVAAISMPTDGGGARRVWSDSHSRLWVTEWFAGKLARYDPATSTWDEWDLPGAAPQPYAVFVDDLDLVWVTDFGANALHRFDPETEQFLTLQHESQPANVRQLLGRPGELWGAESAADQLTVIRPAG